MELSPISPWASALLLLMATLCGGWLWMTDRRLWGIMTRGTAKPLGVLLGVGALTGATGWADSWWASLGAIAVAAFAATIVGVRRSYKMPAAALSLCAVSSVATVAAVSALLVAMLPLPAAVGGKQAFTVVGLLLTAQLYCFLPSVLTTYLRSVSHTESHIKYLLANGATRFEAVVPSIRRALRAVVVWVARSAAFYLPAVLALLACGLPLWSIAVVAVMMFVGSFSLSVLVSAATMVVADRWLITPWGNLKKENREN